jgi:hypothetical protein
MPPASGLPLAVIDPSTLRAVAIPRFIQLGVPLLPLKLTDQLRRGVIQEAQVRPLVTATPRFTQHPPQQSATFLLFFSKNLPVKPLEQVKIARLMPRIKCLAHQHEQKINHSVG